METKIGEIKLKDKNTDMFLRKYNRDDKWSVYFKIETYMPKELNDIINNIFSLNFKRLNLVLESKFEFSAKIERLEDILSFCGKKFDLTFYKRKIGEIKLIEKEKVIENLITYFI